ncbi:hypothetical protein [Ahrensia sp. 13_GOM-1096m]|uniref:hypothetical protein n=1 Tax=Ahrensia sp. 13_GOM-1096m TaxID=1380380 RepID=UPI00047BDFC5|nr:hypothetical protein [Ahrensia sp. 13_GOM-1096m]
MPDYSDAALLTGNFAHMVAELKAGKRKAPSPDEWQKTACDNEAEQAAQSVAKQIFELQSAIDKEKEQLEIVTISAAGPMLVMGLFAGEGDVMRVEGLLLSSKQPVALVIHASQLALTITKRSTAEAKPEEDATQIGFVIFDQLEKRAKAKPEVAPQKKPAAKAKTNRTKRKT